MAPSFTSVESVVSPSPAAKKTAASLLPAAELFSSSPALPRPLKRNRDALEDRPTTYPTPVPTSSTHILSSSPSHAVQSTAQPHHRTASTLSERQPLGAVPSIRLAADGKITRMGRSSASCDYQFSSNRLVSRIHVEACYKSASSSLERDHVEILCTGWNGIKIHCQGKVFEVKKGETFCSDVRDAEIMVDVHDSRVTVEWPPKPVLGPLSSDEEEDVESPTKKQRLMMMMRRHSTPPSPSPLQNRRRLASPISPSPAVQAVPPSSPPLAPGRSAATDMVEIYEDPPEHVPDENVPATSTEDVQPPQVLTQTAQPTASASHSTVNSSLTEDFSDDNDEENDPIIHSFGPFGANLLPRMASFTAGESPIPSASKTSSRSSHTEPLHPGQGAAHDKTDILDVDVKDHIINQLAYSRLSSTPLSTILSHLPSDAEFLARDELRAIIASIACIGEVAREGKDAAGKRLESEFYYIPDLDEDEKRKKAVVDDLGKPGLRACRKQHKQYYWRKPK